MDEDRLFERLRDALEPTRREPSADRIARLRLAVVASHAQQQGPIAPPRGWWRLPVLGRVAAAFAVGAVVGAVGLGALRAPEGELEFMGTVMTDDGSSMVASVRRTGIGRVIHLDSDALPVLPTGDFYEVWFVGPGDMPDNPNRISAGTFHPDPDGGVEVQFAAAVDPTLYPTLSITIESGDGDPAPSDNEILRASLSTE